MKYYFQDDKHDGSREYTTIEYTYRVYLQSILQSIYTTREYTSSRVYYSIEFENWYKLRKEIIVRITFIFMIQRA